MPRDLPLSNGNLLVNFDLEYRIRDIFFPWVGLENHTRGQEFRFGIWVDGQFSWMGNEWIKDLRYRDDTLVTDVTLTNEPLGLKLHCQEAVDAEVNVYVRQVEVTDLSGRPRDVRLFFCHDFHLYGHEIGDTAYFDPPTRSVIHYKLSRYFLAACRSAGSEDIDYFSCGVRATPGRQPSWKDAEDGELDRIPISWGYAESTVGVRVLLGPGGSDTVSYWLAAGTNYHEVAVLNALVIEKTPSELIERTARYWQAWARKEPRDLGDLPESITQIFNRSLLVLRSQIDNAGAIIAANDSDIVRFGGDTYSYMWGRDGAFVAAALAKAGYSELCRGFFRFCSRALGGRGFLFQHYTPDGSLASNWHAWLLEGKEVLPIQEDSTALILWSLWIEYESSRDIEFIRSVYDTVVIQCAEFLCEYRDPNTLLPTPSYDLWEERYGVHTYTVASVIAGLRAAANFAGVFQDAHRVDRYNTVADAMAQGITDHLYDPALGRYVRSGYPHEDGYRFDTVLDVSLLCLVTLGVLSAWDPRVVATAAAIRAALWCDTPIGGLARYGNDYYQRESDVPPGVPGNPWFISTLWLAEYVVMQAEDIGQLHEALPYLEWCTTNALPSGVLAEQVHPVTGVPLSVSPLTWSHSSFVWVVLAYAEKHRVLSGETPAATSARLSG